MCVLVVADLCNQCREMCGEGNSSGEAVHELLVSSFELRIKNYTE